MAWQCPAGSFASQHLSRQIQGCILGRGAMQALASQPATSYIAHMQTRRRMLPTCLDFRGVLLGVDGSPPVGPAGSSSNSKAHSTSCCWGGRPFITATSADAAPLPGQHCHTLTPGKLWRLEVLAGQMTASCPVTSDNRAEMLKQPGTHGLCCGQLCNAYVHKAHDTERGVRVGQGEWSQG